MSVPAPKDRLLAHLRAALDEGIFVKLTLGGPRGADRSLRQVIVRAIELRGAPHLSFVWRQATRDVTRNLTPDDGLALLQDLIGKDFRTANLFTTRQSFQLEFRDGHGTRWREGPPVHAAAPSPAHDTPKARRLAPADAPWLAGLGVTTPDGKVARGMEAKFRQIHQFLEVLAPLLPPPLLQSGASPVLVDMGCGKGYLTFAACDWLQRAGTRPRVTGWEVRPELVEAANRLARDHGFTGLRFQAGTIADATLEHVDVLMALHACDTATDDALARGIDAGARVLLVSPCCHKEIRPQLRPPPALAGALRHGILREREAEFVTDALRAALLEWAGYDTKVFEFISPEHTAKNLMIAATRRASNPESAREDAARRVRDLAAFYGVRAQHLAARLGFALAPDSPPCPT